MLVRPCPRACRSAPLAPIVPCCPTHARAPSGALTQLTTKPLSYWACLSDAPCNRVLVLSFMMLVQKHNPLPLIQTSVRVVACPHGAVCPCSCTVPFASRLLQQILPVRRCNKQDAAIWLLTAVNSNRLVVLTAYTAPSPALALRHVIPHPEDLFREHVSSALPTLAYALALLYTRNASSLGLIELGRRRSRRLFARLSSTGPGGRLRQSRAK